MSSGLEKEVKVSLCLLMAFTLFAINSQTIVQASTWQEEMLSSLNSIRAEKKLAPVILCKPLVSAAQTYSASLANQNFLSHKGKDGSTPAKRMQKAGYKWQDSKTGSMVAENIAGGQNSVSEVMKGWRNSSGHFKNMVEVKFTHVGFGKSVNSKSKFKTYWVQNFGYGASC
jgi:uncharacterized protein YkwD